jgi:subfamily B ATP-binding cassette protein MsbA
MPAQAARCSQFVDRTLEAGASFLLYLVALVYLSPGLAIVAVVLLGFYLHGFNVLLRRIEDLTEQVDADDARSAVRTLELLRNLPLVWLLGTEDEEVERAAEAGRQRSRLGITRERLEDGVKPLRESLTVAVTIAFILLAVLLARGMGSESLGIYLLFFLIFRRAIAKFAGILTVRSDLRVHADRLRRLLDTVRAEPPFVVSGGTSRFDGIARGLAVRDLEFGYRQRKPVLKGVSMDIEAGSTTYLVGATGCGKTTVVKLFLRLYEFENGAIRVDGTDIREYDVRSWRKAMGFCGSQPLLFDDTVRANVTYGIEDVSEDRIWKAAELAEAREFLEEMDDRLDEVVGEQGSHLSMGQAQRIGLMRLFLRPTPVVILDEATSALDPATEATILENLDSGGTGRTTLIVAHRLNIIPEDAPVVVMARGRVADQGTREELLSRRGEFRRLWRGMERSRRGTGMGRRSAG